ncbi:hypothetical protein ACM66B_006607 [Microbotryomycetes sp. NB124-2]
MIAVGLGLTTTAYFATKTLAKVWHDLNHPHAHVFQHNPFNGSRESLVIDDATANELTPSELVRPVFGPKNVGVFQQFDLGAAIWALVPDPDYQLSTEPNSSPDALSDPTNLLTLDEIVMYTEERAVKNQYYEELNKFKWQLAFSDVVLKQIDIETRLKSVTANVTLSRELLQQTLFNGSTPPTLMAQFFMMPCNQDLDASQIIINNVTTLKRAHRFGTKAQFPPLPPNLIPSGEGNEGQKDLTLYSNVLRGMVVMAATGPATNETSPNGGRQPYLNTRTRVSFVPDAHLLRKGLYLKRRIVRESWRRRECPDWKRDNKCIRSFKEDGPFETFIEYTNASRTDQHEAPSSEFLYGPYMTTRAQFPGPNDYVKLVNSSESLTGDLSFDWHIIWASDNFAKFNFVNDMSDNSQSHVPYNMTKDEMKGAQAAVDFHRSMFRVHHEEDSKHLKWSLMMMMSFALSMLIHPLSLHYWYTRRVATGVSLSTVVPDHAWGLFVESFSIVQLVRRSGLGLELAFSLPSLLFRTVMMWPIVLLYMRLEWRWGGPGGFWPIVVRRRPWSHRERATQKVDQLFDWRWKVVIGLVHAGWSLHGPTLPAILHLGPKFVGERDEPVPRWTIENYLHSISPAVSFVNIVAQAWVNYRQRTFAGDHRLSIYLLFSSLFTFVIPILLSFTNPAWSRVGEPVHWDLIWQWLTLMIIVGQALKLPSVPQVEDVDE